MSANKVAFNITKWFDAEIGSKKPGFCSNGAIAPVEGEGLEPYAQWARAELARLKAMPREVRDKGPALVPEAIKLLAQQDYLQVIELLEAVPEGYRSTEASHVLKQAQDLAAEADRLNERMKQAVRDRQYDGLRENVLERLLELEPGNLQARDIYEHLGTYGPDDELVFGDDGMLLPARGRYWWLDRLAQLVYQRVTRRSVRRGKAGARRKGEAEPATDAGSDVPLVPIAIGLGVLGVVGLLLGIVFLLRDGRQTVRVEMDPALAGDATVSVWLDGKEMEIAGLGETIKLKPGEHGYEIRRGDEVIAVHEFTILKGDNPALRISVEEEAVAEVQAKPTAPPPTVAQAEPEKNVAAKATSPPDGAQGSQEPDGPVEKAEAPEPQKAGAPSAAQQANEHPTPAAEPTDAASKSAGREAEAAIETALSQPTRLAFIETPLEDILAYLRDVRRIQIFMDRRSFDKAKVRTNIPITINSRDNLATSLETMLDPVKLTWVVRHDVLLITSKESAEAMLDTRVYKLLRRQPLDNLIEDVTRNIAPTSWDKAGGPGSISPVPFGALVILQTQANHRQIEGHYADLLKRVQSPLPADLPESVGGSVGKALSQPTRLQFIGTPLEDIIAFLRSQHDVRINIDMRALNDVGIRANVPITCDLKGVRLSSALSLILRDIGLTWTVNRTGIRITNAEAAAREMQLAKYRVDDLAQDGRIDYLVEAVTSSVAPGAGDERGDAGSIRQGIQGTLDVRQTFAVHWRVAQVLADLRAARDSSGMMQGPQQQSVPAKAASPKADVAATGEGATIEGEGDPHAVVDDYQQAMDRVAQELMSMMDKGPVLVVWAFDESGSMKGDRQEIRQRINNIYVQLDRAGRDGKMLQTSVVSYGAGYRLHVRRPTADVNLIRQAIDAVPDDKTGKEMMCQAVGRAIVQHREYAQKAGRQMALILVTDESGEQQDNYQYLEPAIAEAKAAQCRIYVLGRESLFGYPYMYMRWEHPQTHRIHWLRVNRGPETGFVEQLQIDGFRRRHDAFPSGFGLYEQCRMARETGGVYFMLPSVESAQKRRYELEIMRPYRPDLRARVEVLADRDRYPLRKIIWTCIYDLNPYRKDVSVPIEMRVEFSTQYPEFVRQARIEQAKAKRYLVYLARVQRALEQGASHREREADPRWQGNFDLIYAQVIAYQARIWEYGATLEESIKNPKTAAPTKPPNRRFVHWDVVCRTSTLTQESKPYIKRATVLFNLVKQNHPGTPWADRADWELRRGFGVDFRPEYHRIDADPKVTIPIPKL